MSKKAKKQATIPTITVKDYVSGDLLTAQSMLILIGQIIAGKDSFNTADYAAVSALIKEAKESLDSVEEWVSNT